MRFGIIGCGVIAQVMYLPYLAEIPEVDLHALVDPAKETAEQLSDRYNVPHSYRDHQALLENVGSDLDASIVLTPFHTHADIAVDTLEAGIPTLVEKPISATPDDASRMVDAAEASDATAMVAYMKRYDPTYEQASEAIDGLKGIDLVTAYDVDPDHSRIIHEVYDIVESNPPEEFIRQSASKREVDIRQAIGTDEEWLVDAYDFQLEHVCHDINALRGLFGEVEHINFVDLFADGRYATAQLTYEDGVRCVLETGDSDRKWFEEFIRIDGSDGTVTLEFSNPFIKNTPTVLTIKQGVHEVSETNRIPSYEESFKRELEYFIECIDGTREVRTTFAEARDDLQVIVDLFRTFRGEEPRPV